MKLSKVAFAVAGLVIASGSAFAGQIDSSSATLAREVIYSDAQTLRAPSKSYAFVGSIDARTNEQRLQLQWTLNSGLKWSRLGDFALTTTDQVLPAGALQNVLEMSTTALGNNLLAGNGAVVSAFLTNGDTTLVFNITIPATAATLYTEPSFQLNANNFAAPAVVSNFGVTAAKTVAGDTACVAPDKTVNINFKHFTNHLGNNTVLTGDVASNPDSEHLRTGHTSDGRFLSFTENLRFTFANGVQSQTDAATLRKTFIRSAAELLPTGYGTAALAAGANTAAVNLHRISTGIDLKKVASGLDLDYTNQYGLTGVFAAADFDVNATGDQNTGLIDLLNLVIEVKSPLGAAGWSTGSTVVLLDSLDVLVPGAVTSAISPAGVVTVTFNTAADAAAFLATTGAKLYYKVTGLAEVPQNSTFEVTAKLVKDKTGTLQEQDNICKANLAGVGGGIKIDIRNYASKASFPAGDYATVVRLINNSESQTADIFAQMIYSNGTYGPWGQLPALAPRAAANYSNAQLEALLVNSAPATANSPFAPSTVYTATVGTAVVAGPTAGVGDRVRFVSNTGTTLRAQSYLVYPGGVLDVTNAQGVDFENNGDRVPVTAVDAQPVSQDAINSLAK